MTQAVQLQEILIDRKDPFFTLCTSPERPGKLLVYFGMSLLEVIDDDPNSPGFKLLLARLYNAGVKPKSLIETFSVAYTTLCRWGDALKSGDSEKLISVLAGRQHPRKLTTEILSFSENRFYAIYPENHYSYSKVIRQEILDTFDVSISGESLRPYFTKWRSTLATRAEPESASQNTERQQAKEPFENFISTDDETINDKPQQGQQILLLSPESIDNPQVVAQSQTIESSPQAQLDNSTVSECLSSDNEETAEQPDTNTHSRITVYWENNPEFGTREVASNESSEKHNRKNAVVLVSPQPTTPEPNSSENTAIQGDSKVHSTAAQSENNRRVGQEVQEVPHGNCGHNNERAVILAEPQIITPSGGYRFCHHAGVLLFSYFLNELKGAITTGEQLIKQWMTGILLGAVNIEQTKLLNYPSLECFLGQTLSNRHKQRQELTEIAQTSCLNELLQLNGQWVNIHQCSDFHYDPHSKHYTGENKLLKGWCSRLRFAEKVLHMDFIHMSTGEPVYMSHDDNYLDLRERFFNVVGEFRKLFGFTSSTPLTFIVDRGIYGIDTFKKFLADDTRNHFITWEKGFRADHHKDIELSGSMSICRAKNSSNDLQRYHFSYHSELWSRNDKIRRIIVKATNPKNRSITVSILCSDLERCVKEIIALIFDRWIQENDFKYLDVHFGINEITSYAILSYKDIEKTLQDKQEKSGVFKALEKQRTKLQGQLKTQLLNEHRAKNKSKKREEKIAQLTKQLNELEEKLGQTEQEVSRLKRLSEEGFNKLNTEKKSLMDGVKILARNAFYKLLRPFKNNYDNYRDDHMLLRHLTRSPGMIQDTGDGIEVLLIPQACFPPKVMHIFNSMLDKFNYSQPRVPDGTGRKISIHLLQNNKELYDVTLDGEQTSI